MSTGDAARQTGKCDYRQQMVEVPSTEPSGFCRHVYLKSPGLRMCICASLLAQTHRHRTGMTKRTSKQDSSCSRFFFLDTLFYLFKDNCFCPHLGISVYFLISSDFPVISAGCSIPISWIRVGAISARQPPSLSP